jgi:hypothetical protein
MAPKRHPLNRGDFYINYGDCIACGAPWAEAPDIVEHTQDNHCYFKKQPETEAEMDQAIRALGVSCIAALRYGGSDESILKRLHENGMADLCDQLPQHTYRFLIRNRVFFTFTGRINEIADLLIQKLTALGTHVKTENLVYQGDQHFRFFMSWTGGARSLLYRCNKQDEGTFLIQLGDETDQRLETTAGTGWLVHDFLKADDRITNIKWFARNSPAGVTYDKPY